MNEGHKTSLLTAVICLSVALRSYAPLTTGISITNDDTSVSYTNTTF